LFTQDNNNKQTTPHLLTPNAIVPRRARLLALGPSPPRQTHAVTALPVAVCPVGAVARPLAVLAELTEGAH